MAFPAQVEATFVDRRRMLFICLLAASLGVWAALVARFLLWLIEVITAFSFQIPPGMDGPGAAPVHTTLGVWIVIVPVVGGLIVGLMARYGSEAIRGHGIPEALENILLSRSRISPRVLFLKPLSAAISIGTGGPFGAEGPIIQTGGALGSVLSQFQSLTAVERKCLLAAGAAAGMAATFQAPVASALLAVELLLFEFRARTLLPVAIASAVAAAMRIVIFHHGAQPLFPLLHPHHVPTALELLLFVGLGLVAGVAAIARCHHWKTRSCTLRQPSAMRSALPPRSRSVTEWSYRLGCGRCRVCAASRKKSAGWEKRPRTDFLHNSRE